ncbi:hypothetical protein [Vibrio sp. S12_S33]|uniref:hypothetical protein n=1 Tax=Vibrio sp. S12_S33 TaxID=2720223 RepID=UPI001784E03F|nr:hypothetical protein [Vibrio sp. S12_S33]MBD1566731.1 hypothetical protein [Vibrio sp. S12_S33]
MPEYISQYLQCGYKSQTEVANGDRLAYNSWDMIKANSDIDLAEKGETFKIIIDQLYAIATSYCQNKEIDHYKLEAECWLDELIYHYKKEQTLRDMIIQLKVDDTSDAFNLALQKINTVIQKIRTLNIVAGSPKDEDELRELERILFGTVISGVAHSLRWGSYEEQYSVLNNYKNFESVTRILQDNDSSTQSDFWREFFREEGGVSKVWNKFQSLNLSNDLLGSQSSQDKICAVYPILANPVNDQGKTLGGTTDVVLSSLTLLLGIGQYTWATATDREDWDDPVSLIELSSAFVEGSLQISYEILAHNVTKFLFGDGSPVTDQLAKVMSKFSQYLGKLTGSVAKFMNLEKTITSKLFLGNVSKLIDKCFLGLAFLAVGIASWSLSQAIISGDIADIVWSSVNLIISGAAFGLALASFMGYALAGPVGIIVAIVGIIIAIAQWIFEAFRIPNPSPTPIQRYTSEVISPNELIHPDLGYYICRTRVYDDLWGCFRPFNIKDMNTDWRNIDSVEDVGNIRRELSTLVVSKKRDKIYYFGGEKIKNPEYGKSSEFFEKGFTGRLNWSVDYSIQHAYWAVECVDKHGNSAAAFICSDRYYTMSLYLTNDIEEAPKNKFIFDQTTKAEDILDVVAVNNQDSCIFIIICKNNKIYQIKNSKILLLNPEFSNSYEDNFVSKLSAVCTGNMVSIFYTIRENSGIFQTVLELDQYNNFTRIRTLRALANAGSFDNFNSIVGHYIPAKDNMPGRHEFIIVDNRRYIRFGAIESTIQNEGQATTLNLFSGVEFEVLNNEFQGFYKNSFIANS